MRIKKEKLLSAMNEARLTSQKLAEKTEMSITQISNIRNRKGGSTIDTARKIAKALNIPVDELIEFDDAEGSGDEQ